MKIRALAAALALTIPATAHAALSYRVERLDAAGAVVERGPVLYTGCM